MEKLKVYTFFQPMVDSECYPVIAGSLREAIGFMEDKFCPGEDFELKYQINLKSRLNGAIYIRFQVEDLSRYQQVYPPYDFFFTRKKLEKGVI